MYTNCCSISLLCTTELVEFGTPSYCFVWHLLCNHTERHHVVGTLTGSPMRIPAGCPVGHPVGHIIHPVRSHGVPLISTGNPRSPYMFQVAVVNLSSCDGGMYYSVNCLVLFVRFSPHLTVYTFSVSWLHLGTKPKATLPCA